MRYYKAIGKRGARCPHRHGTIWDAWSCVILSNMSEPGCHNIVTDVAVFEGRQRVAMTPEEEEELVRCQNYLDSEMRKLLDG